MPLISMFKRILLICALLLCSYTHLYADNNPFSVDGINLNTAKQNAKYYFRRAIAADEKNQPNTALKNYKKALSLEPNNIQYSYSLATIFTHLKDDAKALEVLNRVDTDTKNMSIKLDGI